MTAHGRELSPTGVTSGKGRGSLPGIAREMRQGRKRFEPLNRFETDFLNTSDQGLRRFGLLTTVSELLDDRIDSEALDWATQALQYQQMLNTVERIAAEE